MTGEELRRIRTRRGIPKQVLGELIGASDGDYISELEASGRIPEYVEKMLRQALRLPVPNKPEPNESAKVRTSSGVRF